MPACLVAWHVYFGLLVVVLHYSNIQFGIVCRKLSEGFKITYSHKLVKIAIKDPKAEEAALSFKTKFTLELNSLFR